MSDRLIGALVDRMIRRSVRKSFHGVYWMPPEEALPQPSIFVANHHGWHDGYVMHHALSALGLRALLWIQEYEAFPLFGKVGGLPFPANDPHRRAVTIRRTVRKIQQEKDSLLLFAEGVLHLPPTLLPFGRSLDFVAARLPDVPVVPVAIRYEQCLHERPECFLQFGRPLCGEDRRAHGARLAVAHLLDDLAVRSRHERASFELLSGGTPDVNERWDLRRIIKR